MQSIPADNEPQDNCYKQVNHVTSVITLWSSVLTETQDRVRLKRKVRETEGERVIDKECCGTTDEQQQ